MADERPLLAALKASAAELNAIVKEFERTGLGQDWVSRVTTSSAPEQSVLGAGAPEPLHTGDDERLDLLTAIRDYIEHPDEDADQRADDLEAVKANLDTLDALVIATVERGLLTSDLFTASCGAKFDTYEEMAQHEQAHHAETLGKMPLVQRLTQRQLAADAFTKMALRATAHFDRVAYQRATALTVTELTERITTLVSQVTDEPYATWLKQSVALYNIGPLGESSEIAAHYRAMAARLATEDSCQP